MPFNPEAGSHSVDDINPLKDWISWAEDKRFRYRTIHRLVNFRWVSRGKPDRQFTGVLFSVQNYLIDVNQAAEKSKLNRSKYGCICCGLMIKDNARNAELVLDTLRKLSEKQVYSGDNGT